MKTYWITMWVIQHMFAVFSSISIDEMKQNATKYFVFAHCLWYFHCIPCYLIANEPLLLIWWCWYLLFSLSFYFAPHQSHIVFFFSLRHIRWFSTFHGEFFSVFICKWHLFIVAIRTHIVFTNRLWFTFYRAFIIYSLAFCRRVLYFLLPPLISV